MSKFDDDAYNARIDELIEKGIVKSGEMPTIDPVIANVVEKSGTTAAERQEMIRHVFKKAEDRVQETVQRIRREVKEERAKREAYLFD